VKIGVDYVIISAPTLSLISSELLPMNSEIEQRASEGIGGGRETVVRWP
jgi:hypothetical protein